MVTGAASGIGLAMTRRLVEAGAEVVAVDRDEGGLSRASAKLSIESVTLDLLDREGIRTFWEGLDPTPDILINNAGLYPPKAFTEVDQDLFRKVMGVNLEGPFWMCQDFIRARRRTHKGGVILNVGSIEAILPFKPDLALYATSKAALIALTRSLAREYGPRFRVNALVPGWTHTPGTQRLSRKALGQPRLLKEGYDFLQRLPLRRMADPDEIARIAVVLVSDLASYVHGAVVPVDGGFLSA